MNFQERLNNPILRNTIKTMPVALLVWGFFYNARMEENYALREHWNGYHIISTPQNFTPEKMKLSDKIIQIFDKNITRNRFYAMTIFPYQENSVILEINIEAFGKTWLDYFSVTNEITGKTHLFNTNWQTQQEKINWINYNRFLEELKKAGFSVEISQGVKDVSLKITEKDSKN